jgi:hypothetical protein
MYPNTYWSAVSIGLWDITENWYYVLKDYPFKAGSTKNSIEISGSVWNWRLAFPLRVPSVA